MTIDEGVGWGGSATLHNALKALEAVDQMNLEAGLNGPASNPFRKAAEAEAADDAMIGIQRDEAWIKTRAKAIFREEKARVKKPDEPLPDFLLRKDLPGILQVLYKCEYPDKVAQEAFDQIIAEQMNKSEVAIREGISVEKVILEEIEKRTKVVKEKLNEDNYQERLRHNKLTLTFLWSMMFSITIPILGAVLPKSLMPLQMLPLVFVLWINWKPMRAFHKAMKNLGKERVSASS